MNKTLNDAWSPVVIVSHAISAVILVLVTKINLWFALLLVPFALLSLIAMLIWFCCDLVKGRLRHGLSIVVAILLAIGIACQAPLLAEGKDKIAFLSRQSEFEQQVEAARAKQTTQRPLQIVVEYEDRSVFVTANSFYYLIYDETDGLGPYEANFWPYAKSPTGVIAVAVPNKMQHLTGHFYSFQTSY